MVMDFSRLGEAGSVGDGWSRCRRRAGTCARDDAAGDARPISGAGRGLETLGTGLAPHLRFACVSGVAVGLRFRLLLRQIGNCQFHGALVGTRATPLFLSIQP